MRYLFILILFTALGCGGEEPIKNDSRPVEIMYDMTGRQYLMLSNGCRMLNLPIPPIKDDGRGGLYSDPITNVEGYEMCEDYGWRVKDGYRHKGGSDD